MFIERLMRPKYQIMAPQLRKKMCLSFLAVVSYVGDERPMHPKKGLRRLKVKNINRQTSSFLDRRVKSFRN